MGVLLLLVSDSGRARRSGRTVEGGAVAPVRAWLAGWLAGWAAVWLADCTSPLKQPTCIVPGRWCPTSRCLRCANTAGDGRVGRRRDLDSQRLCAVAIASCGKLYSRAQRVNSVREKKNVLTTAATARPALVMQSTHAWLSWQKSPHTQAPKMPPPAALTDALCGVRAPRVANPRSRDTVTNDA
jgi:hypothetical protein